MLLDWIMADRAISDHHWGYHLFFVQFHLNKIILADFVESLISSAGRRPMGRSTALKAPKTSTTTVYRHRIRFHGNEITSCCSDSACTALGWTKLKLKICQSVKFSGDIFAKPWRNQSHNCDFIKADITLVPRALKICVSNADLHLEVGFPAFIAEYVAANS